jgi:uncharacterized protein
VSTALLRARRTADEDGSLSPALEQRLKELQARYEELNAALVNQARTRTQLSAQPAKNGSLLHKRP